MTIPAHAADKTPFQHSNRTPIDITSDQLEVLQEQSRAIFTGHVVAIQGDVRLASEKMTVHYRKQEGQDKQDKKPAESGAIDKIEVEKNVFLTTPQETASGDGGVYDVAGQRVVLSGNVVLTRQKNTLRGTHLTYDFKTGKSVITGGDSPSPQTPWRGKQRVRALFVPDEAAKKEQQP